MRGAWSRMLLLTGVCLALLVGAGAAGASTRTSYYVVFMVRGSFRHVIDGMALAGFDQTDVAGWSYRERFGPVNLAKSTVKARTSAAKVSGTWSTSLMYSPDNAGADCSQQGKFVSGAAQMSVVAAAGARAFKGASLVLSAGRQGLAVSPIQNCDDAGEFFGVPINTGASCDTGSGSIREALLRTGPTCSTADYFTAHVRVSEKGLSAHRFTYRVSSAKPDAEKVSPGCNQQDNPSMGYTISCAYSWSGTVSLQPAG